MAKSVEASGKTIEQALQKALKELEAKPEEVDIEILPEAHKGLFGLFGPKTVSIRVSLRDRTGGNNNIELIKNIIDRVLTLMGAEYKLSTEEMPDTTFVNINTPGLDGLLIGRRGETLSSIQHVVNRIFTSKTGQHSKITVDVGGYVKRKHRLLVEKARRVADRVKKTGREADFEPLKASDRRIIHLAISELTDVTTYTIGDGLLRKVVVTPKMTEIGNAALEDEEDNE
ncbi:MAG: KH domain-containing protein [Candidatus Latescibacteria bacterium]|nr:KH domain-containing protein [Candidatus Latescibacterota bacterium]NIM22658.1 KH domain-containing protein [Candidatus Latescibacterota bacterium]NIM64947.1 KH domain-containing protein [Candidatus Latescibacterota bacterium]NIO01462.1 KH domain-containing protein [Candidatus Latescibacterota bacterium]NIO27972.1 KH domain-containing protein [Candidatus Latescibacterota bacterium]